MNLNKKSDAYMQNYLEIKIPIRYDAMWFKALRQEAEKREIPIRWQYGHYHITVIFAYDDEKISVLKAAFTRIIDACPAFSLTLDRIGIFEAYKMNVIYIAPSKSCLELDKLIGELRAEAVRLQANIRPDFRLHITLGKADSASVTPEQLHSLISSIDLPAFEVGVSEVEYLYLHTRQSIGKWKLTDR